MLSDLSVLRGVPGHIRPDDGPGFVAEAVRGWTTAVGAKTACIAPGNLWENGHVESSGARLRDELLDGEVFCSPREAEVVIESRRRHHDTVRPHASPGFRPPAPEVVRPAFAAWPAALRRPTPPTTNTVAPTPDHPSGADHLKAALTATARELLVTLTAMLACGTDYRPGPAT